MKHFQTILLLSMLMAFAFINVVKAQNVHTLNPYLNNDEQNRKSGFSNDSTETTDVPEGIYAWRINERFGDIIPASYDTIPHGFQNENQTYGANGHYNFTGNLGAPRISRYFTEQGTNMQSHPFIFTQPYDFFLKSTQDLLFTNTKSPFTNLSYHSCGNKQNGEDRIKALFSVNAGKKLGMGFKADYLYGRGYYQAQSTAHFDGTLYASYHDEKYQMHTYFQHTYLKNRENGGIESDDYVKRPETFPTRYGTADMPINLDRAWNKIGGNLFYLTHRYSLGFDRYRDAKGRVVPAPKPLVQAPVAKDSTLLAADTLTHKAQPRIPGKEHNAEELANAMPDSMKITREFVPVSSFIHTMRIDDNTRKFIANQSNSINDGGYFNDFFLPYNRPVEYTDSAFERTHHLGIENTFAVELHEGMNRWMKMGLRLYGKHEYHQFSFRLPYIYNLAQKTRFNENYITVGGQLLSQQNKFIRYNVLGEVRTTGTDWGEFNAEANLQLNIPLKRDSLHLNVNAFVRNERPSFYYRHYIGRNANWNNPNLDKMLHSRVQGILSYKDTRVRVSLENVQKYIYFQETLSPFTGTDNVTSYHHSVGVAQANKNLQLLEVSLMHHLHLGIFHWENELTYQATTNSDVYPVPTFNAYSNVYLLFRIAKVLRTELGADVRYFTRYKAPTYSPIIGQYAVQDGNYAVKLGNYPIVNAYVNFHLKRTRFYLMASHLNYTSGAGNPLLVPHYPLNRMTIHFGISWNFVN